MKADIAKLFKVRHIVTHELPSGRPYSADEVESFLTSAVEFARAAEQSFWTLLHGDYPLSTIDMQGAAAEAFGKADTELERAYTELRGIVSDPGLVARAREAWEVFRARHAELRSEHLTGGSYYNIVYAREAERLTNEHIKTLRRILGREEGQL